MKKIYKKDIDKVMPILQALAEGKTIQFAALVNEWVDINSDEDGILLETLINNSQAFRVKPEPKYRPFKDAEECLAEMQKHQLFGWVKNQGLYRNIANVMSCSITFADNEARDVNYEQAFKNYTFADGTPFGVKIE